MGKKNHKDFGHITVKSINANTYANYPLTTINSIGAGEGLLENGDASVVGSTFNFRSLAAGSGIAVNATADTITTALDPPSAAACVRFTQTDTVNAGTTKLYNINGMTSYFGAGASYFSVSNGSDTVTILQNTPTNLFFIVFEVPVRFNDPSGGWGGIEILVNGSSVDYVLESTSGADRVTQFSGKKLVELFAGDVITFRLNAVLNQLEYGRINLPPPATQNPRCLITIGVYI